VRLVLGPKGEIAVDPGDGGFGRGAHVHASEPCLRGAVTRGLPRATRRSGLTVSVGADGSEAAPLSLAALGAAIAAAMDQRVGGLLASATRTHEITIGSDATVEACRRGRAALVLVACDAASSADLTEVRRAVAEGRAIAYGTKDRLGELLQRTAPVGVTAITSERIAGALRVAVETADACRAASRGEPWRGEAPRRGMRGSPRTGDMRDDRTMGRETVGSRQGQRRSQG
jgi:ribosomal protein L7Ae-like RNA K-turn-binding protein